MYTIRKVELNDDLQKVSKMIAAEHRTMLGKTIEQVMREVGKRLSFGAFLHKKEMIGYISFHLWEQNVIEVGGLVVDPPFRGKGIAKKLIARITCLTRKEFPDCKIFILSKNPAALQAFRKNGYKECSHEELLRFLEPVDPWEECRKKRCPCWENGGYRGCKMTAMIIPSS